MADVALPPQEPREMSVSRFDKVVALLLTAILFVGLFTSLLFMLWLWNKVKFPRPEIKVVALDENPAGRGDNAEGFERDFDPPGADEVEQLLEPQVQDTLTAVTDAVTSVAAALDTIDTKIDTTNVGTGKGDSRPPGPEGEGDDIIPRFMRWQLKFIAKNQQGYAQQLDFFKIELAVMGGEVEGVDYAKQFSTSPVKRHGPSETEKRLWFRWTDNGPLAQYDQQLVQKAGIPISAGRFVLMFIEKDLENQLALMELEFSTKAGFPSVKQIAKTIFEVQPTESGYAFKVVDQRYRVPKF